MSRETLERVVRRTFHLGLQTDMGNAYWGFTDETRAFSSRMWRLHHKAMDRLLRRPRQRELVRS